MSGGLELARGPRYWGGVDGVVRWCRAGSAGWFPVLAGCCAVNTLTGAPLGSCVDALRVTSLLWGGSWVLYWDMLDCRRVWWSAAMT